MAKITQFEYKMNVTRSHDLRSSWPVTDNDDYIKSDLRRIRSKVTGQADSMQMTYERIQSQMKAQYCVSLIDEMLADLD